MKKIGTILVIILLNICVANAKEVIHGIDIDEVYNNGDWSSKEYIKQLINDYTLFIELKKQLNECTTNQSDQANCIDTITQKILQNFSSLETNDLNVIVFNFIDMLSHARTESKMIRELASNNAAYRSLTESWFRHSSASDLLRKIAESGYKVILTTDHGTIRVDNPIKVIGDKNTNTNLRYKVGKNLSYNNRQVYEIRRPDRFGLPSPNLSSAYIFAMNGDFFTYPNNYNYYVQYYKDTFQHGGISMEEMLVPIITMQPK